MKIVTAGPVYLDIDAYAGCVAYAELLNRTGHKALAYSSAQMNESVTKTIRSWNAPMKRVYVPGDDDTFILVDVSNPHYVDKAVDIERVEEVIDHHLEYTSYWQDKLGPKADIEFVGAACTQVFEKWVRSDTVSQMSQISARLLLSGILDNTLNFKARVTTDRDKKAYEELLKIADLPDDWPAQYFRECESSILANTEKALLNDSKVMQFPNSELNDLFVGQLVIWDARRTIREKQSVIKKTLDLQSDNWFINIVSIDDGKSSFLASSDSIKQWLEKTLDVKFAQDIAIASRLWLRKEIMQRSIVLANKNL